MTAAEKNTLLKSLMALIADADAPAVAAKPKGKRKLTEEQRAKMAAGRKRAAAAKGGDVKPAAKAKAAKPKGAKAEREVFEGGISLGEGRKDKKKGNTWVPCYVNDEYAGGLRADLARALFLAIRGKAAGDMLAHIELQAE
jgi:hypothetical protein